jgi:hypothetical protein
VNAGLPGPVITATITGTGVLTVWGLDPTPRVLDEGAPPAARNALVNLLHTAALDRGQIVCAAARTPAGPWYFACDTQGVISPLDPAHFTAVTLPDLDTPIVLAGAAAVFAAAAGSPPAAMLALASDPDPAIRAEALAELATWPDDPTPVADAELPADRLELLAGCQLGWVRVGVAANPGTGHTALVRLVADDDPGVLATLAGRFDLPVDLLVQLATNPDPTVQAELTRNPSAAFLTVTQPVPTSPSDEVDDEGRATPLHGVPGLPAWTSSRLTPGRPEDHPDLVATVETSLVAPRPTPSDARAQKVPATVAVALDQQTTTSTQAPQDTTAAAADPASTRLPRRALGLLGAAAAVVLLTVGGYAAVTTLGAAPAPTTSATATAAWNGMALPAGPDGPTDPAGDVATGFARTELGAAMAAAHLSVRIDPYAGPASFEPTITTQTLGGDPGALLAATRDRYTSLGGVGGPIPTTTGQITGWRIDGWTPDAPTTVHLRVAGPSGTATDYGIAVVWVDGDYALVDPTRADTFTTRPADDPTSYRSF